MISTGGHLTILESVDSTNNYAMAGVRSGLAKHGDGFFALAQVEGKGQRGKTWITEPGTNIILTLVMRPFPVEISGQFLFSTAMALAAHDFFAHYAGDETSIKWPNDIYWRDRKAGGILIENVVASGIEASGGVARGEASGDVAGSEWVERSRGNEGKELQTTNYKPENENWKWAIVGMGININQTIFPENIRNAVSLKQITGKHWDVIDLAKNLCAHVQKRYEQLLAGNNLLDEYNAHLFRKGLLVTFKRGSRVFEAIVKEVNGSGQLVVMGAFEECFSFGEIEWRSF